MICSEGCRSFEDQTEAAAAGKREGRGGDRDGSPDRVTRLASLVVSSAVELKSGCA